MQIRMQNAEDLTQEQIEEFLRGSQAIEFRGQNRAERYEFVQRVLVAREYAVQGKKQRGTIRTYSSKVTGLSLPQTARLIRQYRQEGVVEAVTYRRRRFPVKYTARDIAVLAEMDRAHEWLSGPATVHILKREYEQFGRAECARLAEISVAHLYNLRRSVPYRKLAAQWEPTRPSAIGIGERRQPRSGGPAGFSARGHSASRRLGGRQGCVSHQCRGCRDAMAGGGLRGADQRAVSRAVLEAMLHQFPFRIRGFHSDNGSE